MNLLIVLPSYPEHTIIYKQYKKTQVHHYILTSFFYYTHLCFNYSFTLLIINENVMKSTSSLHTKLISRK